jgi:hypothetical protein
MILLLSRRKEVVEKNFGNRRLLGIVEMTIVRSFRPFGCATFFQTQSPKPEKHWRAHTGGP